jgi:hypothetical protein
VKISRSETSAPPKIFPLLHALWHMPIIRIGLLVTILFAAFGMGVLITHNGQIYQLHPIAQSMVEDVVKDVRRELVSYASQDLPTLYIDVAFEDYQRILDKRTEALRLGVLLASDEDFVPARLRYGEEGEVSAEIRLKGDWTDHLRGDKWSFRIHVRNGDQVAGMRRFSIQAPETRQWLDEWAFHQNLLKEGILTTRYTFVNVIFNGESKGIYALEESFSKELLESQGRREGVIIRFDEDLVWRNRAKFTENIDMYLEADTMGYFLVTDMSTAEISAFRQKHIEADPSLSAQAETAFGLLRAFQTEQRPASEIFEAELMGRFYALSALWDAGHTNIWHNIRFYYNPITGLLEPIAFDAMPFDPESPFSVNRIFGDAPIRKAFAQELDRISQPEYLVELEGELGDEFEDFQRVLGWEYSRKNLMPPWNRLRNRQKILQNQLRPAQAVRGTFQQISENHNGRNEPHLQVALMNLMTLPVEVIHFQIGDKLIAPQPDWVTPETRTHLMSTQPVVTLLPISTFEPVRFIVPFKEANQGGQGTELIPLQVSAIVRVAGLSQQYTISLNEETVSEPLLTGPIPDIPDLAEVLRQHPFLSISNDERTLIVQPGDWTVDGDLILPQEVGLIIPPDTALRFQEEAVLLSTAPVIIMGKEDAPVLLTAQHEGWAGIVVLKASEKSVWKHVLIEKTQGVARGGWILTGGITFFESPVTLDHVQIFHSQAEDAVNIIHGTYLFRYAEFAYSVSDAFDGDFSIGEIIHSSFHDIGGDAVDVSGSNLKVSSTSLVNIGDKALSAGEQSVVEAKKLRIQEVGLGVASKDLSNVSLEQVTISDAVHVGLAAYIKKPEYGPATIDATNLSIQNTETEAMVQTNSTISINGMRLETTELDIDALYDQGILGN